MFAIVQKKTGDLSVTRMTVQQDSYDETEDESAAFADDLDPSEIDKPEPDEGDKTAGGDDGADAEASARRKTSTPFSAAIA